MMQNRTDLYSMKTSAANKFSFTVNKPQIHYQTIKFPICIIAFYILVLISTFSLNIYTRYIPMQHTASQQH